MYESSKLLALGDSFSTARPPFVISGWVIWRYSLRVSVYVEKPNNSEGRSVKVDFALDGTTIGNPHDVVFHLLGECGKFHVRRWVYPIEKKIPHRPSTIWSSDHVPPRRR